MKKRHLFWLLPIISLLISCAIFIIALMDKGDTSYALAIFAVIYLFPITGALFLIIGLGQLVYFLHSKKTTSQSGKDKTRNENHVITKFIWITIAFIALYLVREMLMSNPPELLFGTPATETQLQENAYKFILWYIGPITFVIAYVLTIIIVFGRSLTKAKREHIA